MVNAFGLPSTVFVNRAMPKKAFYEHLRVTGEIKEEFVNRIERIELTASIKEASIHLSATKDVVEIDVLSLFLKIGADIETEVPRRAIDAIAGAIPNKLLFVCVHGALCKLFVKRDRLYETEWLSCAEATLELKGDNLSEIWDSLCSQVVFGNSDFHDFDRRLQTRARIATLESELATVNKKRKSERQIGKRNALFDRKRAIEEELSRLKGLA